MINRNGSGGDRDVSRRVQAVRQRAADADLGRELRLFEEKPGHPKGGKVLAFFERGFVWAAGMNFFNVIVWSDVRDTRQQFVSDGSGTKVLNRVFVYTNAAKDVPAITLMRRNFKSWPGVDSSEALEYASYGLQIEAEERQRAAAEIASTLRGGGRESFDAVHVDREGIHVAGQSVRWSELYAVEKMLSQILVYTGSATQASLYLPPASLPNKELFLSVVQEMYLGIHRRPLQVRVPETRTIAAALGNLDRGTLTPPEAPAGLVDDILTAAAERGLGGSPRWYTAVKKETPVPAKGVLALYNHGFAVGWPDRHLAFHWDDIVLITVERNTIAGHPPNIAVQAIHDGRVLDEDQFPGIQRVISPVQDTHSDYLLERIVATLARGEQYQLGTVMLGNDGFTYGDKTVAWADITSIRDHSMLISPSFGQVAVEIRNGKPVFVSKAMIVNTRAFSGITGLRRGAQ